MHADNALEALKICETLLEKILDLPLVTNSENDVFPEDTITSLRKIAEAAIYSRKKKDVGVIGGSLAGVTGGVMTLVGGALIPFTFGTSITLLVSGGAIALAGAGASIGFSIEKIIGDKNRVAELQPHLKTFVDFHRKFSEAMVTIHELLQFLRGKMNSLKSKLSTQIVTAQEQEEIEKISTIIDQLYKEGEMEDDIYDKLKLIDKYVKLINAAIGELVKHVLPFQEMKNFPETAKDKEEKRAREGEENTEEEHAFDRLLEAIPRPPKNEDGLTFRLFVLRYLSVDPDQGINVQSSAAGAAAVGDATGKVMAGGAGVGGRVAIRALDVSDNVATAGGAVARMAKGISAASIVLSAVGIVVDLAFLGHAIYDLMKLNANEDKRKTTETEMNSTEFADILRDLADIMEMINGISRASHANYNN